MLRTNGERLRNSLLEMGRVGGTPKGGVTRLSLTDPDREARDLFVSWARSIGLQVRVDDLGNLYARLEGSEPSAAPVLIGSHLDSVPAGGKFDGALGVLTALEVVRTLAEAGHKPVRSIEVVSFTNEEGARFEPAMMCSGVLAGRFTPEFVYSRQDRDGLSFGSELARIGYLGSAADRPKAIHAYLEVHIEQGPVLEAEDLPLGVVDGILGMRWTRVTLTGLSQHAGTSPMRTRRDPVVAAARIAVALRDLALAEGEPTVATVGRFHPDPGVINQIPQTVAITTDLRHASGAGLDRYVERAEELIRRIATEEKVGLETEVMSTLPPVVFDPSVVGLLEQEVRSLGFPFRHITSGAGHDATYISEIAPTGMLFVRTVGGSSHCETEAVRWEDVEAAADVLLHCVLRLAGE